MSTTLRVIVDQVIAPVPGALGRYTLDLTNAIIAATPPGCDVEGVVSSSTPDGYETAKRMMPGLSGLYTTTLARRELATAWQLGITTSPGVGMIHGTSLFAPLRRHDRGSGETQVVVTVHDLLAWRHPQAMTASSVAWQKAMMKRARKHADAVVVSNHALAADLATIGDFGDRVRVIGTAPRSGLVIGADSDLRAVRLGLPSEYVVVPGSLEPRKGLVDALTALGRPGVPDLPVVVLGPSSWGDQQVAAVAEDSGVAPNRVVCLDILDPRDLAVVLDRAAVFVAPAHDDADGSALIEAFSLGTPVIHSDAPTYVEVAGSAGLAVPLGVADAAYADRLAAAITTLVSDTALAARFALSGHDRSRAFSWRDSGERVWNLHADL